MLVTSGDRLTIAVAYPLMAIPTPDNPISIYLPTPAPRLAWGDQAFGIVYKLWMEKHPSNIPPDKYTKYRILVSIISREGYPDGEMSGGVSWVEDGVIPGRLVLDHTGIYYTDTGNPVVAWLTPDTAHPPQYNGLYNIKATLSLGWTDPAVGNYIEDQGGLIQWTIEGEVQVGVGTFVIPPGYFWSGYSSVEQAIERGHNMSDILVVDGFVLIRIDRG